MNKEAGEKWLREHGFEPGDMAEDYWVRDGLCVWFRDGWTTGAGPKDIHKTPLEAYRTRLCRDRDNYLGLAKQLEGQLANALELAGRMASSLAEADSW